MSTKIKEKTLSKFNNNNKENPNLLNYSKLKQNTSQKLNSLSNTETGVFNTTNYNTQNNIITSPSKNKSIYNSTNSIEDFNQVISNINKEVMLPLKKEIKKKNKNNEFLKKNVNTLEGNVKVLNNALSVTNTKRNNILKKNKISISEIERIKKENKYMEEEIEKIEKEKEKILNEINTLNKEKVLFNNQFEADKEEMENMREEIKKLNEKNNKIINEKKIIKSALLLVQKKIDELKHKVDLVQMKGSDVITNDLKKLADKYKIKKQKNVSDSEEESEDENDYKDVISI